MELDNNSWPNGQRNTRATNNVTLGIIYLNICFCICLLSGKFLILFKVVIGIWSGIWIIWFLVSSVIIWHQSPSGIIGSSGNIKYHLASSGIIWLNLASSDIMWQNLASSGIIWHLLALTGIIWHYQASSGIILHHLASSGIVLHNVASSGNFI